MGVNIPALMLIVAILSAACASAPSADGRRTAVSEELNPIARLDRQVGSSVIVEPMVVNSSWVELRGDGNDIVISSTGPAGTSRPLGSCLIEGENASAMVDALARMEESGGAKVSTLGVYIVRISAIDGGELTALVPVMVMPGTGQMPTVEIDGRQYRLSENDFDVVRKLIAGARC